VLDDREERGRALFHSEALGCNGCHDEATAFSDEAAHDVGTATEHELAKRFLAPSLRFVAGSAPYFHDGRYRSLGELLEHDRGMSGASALPAEDLAALAAYLRTL
jgi:cytochrome c peroxidase